MPQQPQATDYPALVYSDGRAVDFARVQAIEPATGGRYKVNTGLASCLRCGGAGGWKGWPGYTCFRCGGRGKEEYPTISTAYDPAAYAKLLAGRDRAAARKEAARQAFVDAFEQENPGLLLDLEDCGRTNPFLADMHRLVITAKGLSDRQLAACRPAIDREMERQKERHRRQEQHAANAAASQHIGQVGGQIHAVVTIEVAKDVQVAAYGSYRNETTTLRLLVMRTPEGHCLKAFGSSRSFWDYDAGASATVRGTVKQHDFYQGEAQTILTRATLSPPPDGAPPATQASPPPPAKQPARRGVAPVHADSQAARPSAPARPEAARCYRCGTNAGKYPDGADDGLICDPCAEAVYGPRSTVERTPAWQLPQTAMCLPTRPYGVIDAINRVALATGSAQGAMAGSDADYNGHHVRVSFNDYRQYWVAEYTWAGRNVIERGSFEACVRAAKAEYDRGALGASVLVACLMEHEVAFCRSLGFVTEEEAKAQNAAWQNEYLAGVAQAIRMDRLGFTESGTAKLIADAKAAGVPLTAAAGRSNR